MEGSLGVALSKSKAIRYESVGLMAPNTGIMAFIFFGHDRNTSKADIAVRYWAKSSTML